MLGLYPSQIYLLKIKEQIIKIFTFYVYLIDKRREKRKFDAIAVDIQLQEMNFS